jgi:ectoine hydroxylase-related dioxygenase (phytanoyl-CoA dioxygenase family)
MRPHDEKSRKVEEFWDIGYTVFRGLFSPGDVERLKSACARVEEKARDQNYRAPDPRVRFRFAPNDPAHLSLVDWPCLADPVLESFRKDKRIYDVLSPILGPDIITARNALFLKSPGASKTTVGFHQDAQWGNPSIHRNLAKSYVQCGVAMDPHSQVAGGVQIIPRSHRAGFAVTEKPVLGGDLHTSIFDALGLKQSDAIHLNLEPGDVAIWTAYTVHGSGPNQSAHTRTFYVNGYMSSPDCDEGEKAFG